MLARWKIKLARRANTDLTWLLEAILAAFLTRNVGHAWHMLVDLRTSPDVLSLEVRRLRSTRRTLVLARQLAWVDDAVAAGGSLAHRIEIIGAHATRWVEERTSEVLR